MSSPSHDRRASVADTEYAIPDAPRAATKLPDQQIWDNARFALRIISTTLALPFLGIALAGFAAPRGFSGYPVLSTPLAIAILAYDFAEYVVMCVRTRKTGIRPQISLGFELVLSIGGIALSAILINFAFDSYSWHDYYDGREGTPVPGYVANGSLWLGMNIIASVLGMVASLVHFVLFVRDCVEVHHYRKSSSVVKEQEVVPPVNSGFELDGIEEKAPPNTLSQCTYDTEIKASDSHYGTLLDITSMYLISKLPGDSHTFNICFGNGI
ncbi:uncharacterized protein GGS22DRAFT_189445 [Annulohypoxylon maeteangense]|uniref:uncharacterized protein n=1 Tax=Annulohypoxylon maeteangense TaxID=1927788 RepID=UPI0020086318|nr:uncharacterized protein GGS22DRAFT_189445 [Annulohypoxylon maeteangense]KAI0884317.1 hypothetical protein GGS22DRAFT_189445 [Annulohypoxylon maeteangense]